MSSIVVVKNLKKKYGQIEALKGISFTVNRGEIFGILGPNGAGKTTTIRCITTLAKPDEGEIWIDGVSAISQPRVVREKIGYVAQEVALDKILTGRELLSLQASLYHLPPETARERINELIQLLGLQEYASRQTGTYSGGMKKRLDLAAGLLHKPQILILDEPSVGLDIESRKIIWDFLRQLSQEGTTVILTSHYLEEIDALADRLVIIDQGRVIAEGTPSDLKDRIGGERVTVRIREFTPAEEAKTAKEKLSQLPFVKEIIINAAEGNSLNLIVTPGNNALTTIEKTLTEMNLPVFSISQSRPSLDDVYLAATGKTLLQADIEAMSMRDLKAEKKQAMTAG
ncbi:MAG: ATP-binding cassette domain-containing protein [Geminocystis sp.]|nr:ATP-binding cassette domain-containing protein [Geminocystis sp.]HIK37119.1 ATP-binding cassette domain-containing protein [Geminocystis sp. M7585_C2015_104]MCS7147512.1 ATP-binding cassette domain-containing protein [Geminocystis sp.]MCX8077915.1 ATP-binding cassette domain-containing protein [Geminocystis sp.]MDW8115205.1 ATP-binding cassette domain-containing protein [Geminocystis sp.]